MKLHSDQGKVSVMENSIKTWNRYAPFFVLEEGTIYPVDKREMEFYRSLRMDHPGYCLELGAGSGRLAECLSNGALSVGLEPSDGMLALWNDKTAGLCLRVKGIAQILPFSGGLYDLVVFPYNGFQEIKQKKQRRIILEEVFRVLKPSRYFVLEICHRFAFRHDEENVERYNIRINDSRFLQLVESVNRDETEGTITYDMTYRITDMPDRKIRLDMAIIDPDMLTESISSAGFTVSDIWGDYDRSCFHPEESPRLIVRSNKPG